MHEKHVSVLLNEVLNLTNCRKGGTHVDATIGNAGHALHLLQNHPDMKLLVGIDCDAAAVQRAEKRLAAFSNKTIVLHGNFKTLRTTLEKAGIHKIDGILFDLGVSTSQLKDPLRGLSFRLKGPLDMRLDKSTPLQAHDLVNQSSARELEKIIRDYGEERWARRISVGIKKHLENMPIQTTTELSSIVFQSIPARFHPKKIHPATKTFQALRIAVNDELTSIEKGLDSVIDMLNPGGRLCVISFHSLEDRIVKNKFKYWEKGCNCPTGLPFCACNEKKKLKIITRKPIQPSIEEIAENPRARSAKLRVGERI